MKRSTIADIRRAATPEHLTMLRRVATTHPDAARRSSAAELLAAIEAPAPPPAPAPRSPALLAELAAAGHAVRVTPEEALASMRAGHVRGSGPAPATHDDPAFDAWLAQTFGGGGDRVEQVVAGRRAETARRTALAAADPAGAEHAAELRALGLADMVTASGGRA